MQKIFSIVLLLLMLGSMSLQAQEQGKIAGVVKDATTGEYLPGANVIIKGTNYGVSTDRFGKYRLNKVDLGTHTISVSYIGYEAFSTTVELKNANYTVELNIELNMSAVQIEDVVVSGLLQGQVKALNQQLNSREIKNVLSREEMEKFPDMNTAEVLQRIPGVNIARDQGEGTYVYIRGTEPRLTSITVDGQKLATSANEDRVTDLGIVNATQLASVEVTKALTPEMDANGIGGQVNLVTRSSFDYEDPTLRLDVGSGYAVQGGNPLYKLAASYVGFLGDNKEFGYTVSGSFYQNNINGQSNSSEWGDLTLVNREVIPFALQDFDLFNRQSRRNHWGFSGVFEYRPNNVSTYYVRGMYNLKDDEQTMNNLYFRLGDGRWYDANTVQSSRMDFSMINERTRSTLVSVAMGGQNNFDLLDIDYDVSYSNGKQAMTDPSRVRSEWAIKQRPSFTVDFSDPDYPVFTMTDTNKDADYIFNPSNYSTDTQEFKDVTTTNTNMSATINVKLPYDLFGIPAELKSGAKFFSDKKDRKGVTLRMKWSGANRPTMDQISNGETIADFLNDHYLFSPMIDVGMARDLINSTYGGSPGLIDDMGGSGIVVSGDGVGGIYTNTENTYSFYMMTTFNVSDLMVMVGVRDEYTSTNYEGNNILFDNRGDASSVEPSSTKTNYNSIFPYLHLKYKIAEATNIRAAFTQSIARPNYYDLAPYYFMDSQERALSQGNPNLEPTLATNFDLMLEHYFQGIGVASVGLFYKNIDKIIYTKNWTETEGEFSGYDMEIPVNAGMSKLYGFEINWQQQFSFLPGFLSGFGIYANYSFTKSEADLEFRDWTVIPGQAGDVGNLGLSYEKDGITARLSANYRSEVLQSVGDTPDYDEYDAANLRLDFSCVYQLFDNLSFYLNVMNITNSVDKSYMGISSRPTHLEFYGISGDAGVKFSL